MKGAIALLHCAKQKCGPQEDFCARPVKPLTLRFNSREAATADLEQKLKRKPRSGDSNLPHGLLSPLRGLKDCFGPVPVG
jgi:hypothetical protein